MSRSLSLLFCALLACEADPLAPAAESPDVAEAPDETEAPGEDAPPVLDTYAAQEAAIRGTATATVTLATGDTDPRLAFHAAAIDATGAGYNAVWSHHAALGYAPVVLSGEATSDGLRWNGVWHRDPSIVAWTSRRGLTHDAYSALWTDLAADGWRVLDLDPYVVDGAVRWNGIWVKDRVRKGWASYRGLTEAGLRDRIASQAALGRRPLKINGYRIGGATRYAVVFVADGLAFQAELGLTSSEYGAAWSRYRQQGYRPADIAAFDGGDGLRFAGVWVQDPAVEAWTSLRNMTTSTYTAQQRDLALQGYIQVDADLYRANGGSGGTRHAGVWVRHAPRDVLHSSRPTTGTAADALRARIASYGGTLGVYVEDLQTGHWVGVNHHEPFYMASTTKVHVATAILQEVDAGALALSDPWTFQSTDYRQASDPLNRDKIGESFTVDRYLRWMINNSSTGATDKLVGWLGERGVNDALRADARVDVGEITSICTLDKRIASRWNGCVHDVPCHIFEPYWRDGESNRTWNSCLSGTKSHTTAEWDRGYDAYYATLANSATPAAFGRYWRDLIEGDVLEAPTRDRLLEILAATGKGSVDDAVVGQGYYDRMGGKHGGKRRSRSWVGIAWDDAPSGRIGEITPRYAVALFAEDWDDAGDGQQARDAIRDTLRDALDLLQ